MRVVACCALVMFCGCADMEADPGERARLDRAVGRADLRSLGEDSPWALNAPGAPPDPGDPPDPQDPGGCDSPLAQQGVLKAESLGTLFDFGQPIAIDGDTMVVGAPYSDYYFDSDGMAFVFVRDGDGWSQQAQLLRTYQESDEGDFFGMSVAIQGDLIAVGSPNERNGVVHFFERTGTEWTRTSSLEPAYQQSDGGGSFGMTVVLDGDRLAVAHPFDSSNASGVGGDPANEDAPFSGAVHVYTRDGAGWAPEAYIKASNNAAAQYFGSSLALSGDVLAAGSYDDSSATGVGGDESNTDAPDSGAVFVFRRGAGGWAQGAYLKASNTEAGDGFGVTSSPGKAIVLSGNRLVVGAGGEDGAAAGVGGDQTSNGAPDSGAVYVFTRTGQTWTQEAYLKASNPGAGDLFGSDMAPAGDRLLVSAPREDSDADGIDGDQTSDAAPEAGAAYLFERQGTWAQRHYIKATPSEAGDFFGLGAASDGSLLAIGAFGQYVCPDPDPERLCENQGAVYLFE